MNGGRPLICINIYRALVPRYVQAHVAWEGKRVRQAGVGFCEDTLRVSQCTCHVKPPEQTTFPIVVHVLFKIWA